MEKNKPNAAMDLTLGNPQTYTARMGVKRAAAEAIKRLEIDYRKELTSSAVFILVTGNGRDQFTQLASGETFGCFSADPDAFYKDLVSRVNPSLFGRESARHLFNIIGNNLEDKMLELDVNSYNALMFNDKYNSAVRTPEELVPLVRNAVNDQVGSEIVGLNAVHSIVGDAIKRGHAAKVTPVILNTQDETFALDLLKNLKRLTSKVFLVVAGKATKTLTATEHAVLVKSVSEESVGEALEKIRSKL
jgi:hypothetical protein